MFAGSQQAFYSEVFARFVIILLLGDVVVGKLALTCTTYFRCYVPMFANDYLHRFHPSLALCRQADAECDDLLECFQTGGLSVQAFVDQYVAAREGFHIIDMKRQAAEHSMSR